MPGERILIYGFGNPGRQDDALGVLLASEIEEWIKQKQYKNISIDQNYQLNIEDSEIISHYDLVVFADATINKTQSFTFDPVHPGNKVQFTMHSVEPSFIVSLCEQIFGRSPKAFLLQIRGYKWEPGEKISLKAKKNLLAAIDFVKSMIDENQKNN